MAEEKKDANVTDVSSTSEGQVKDTGTLNPAENNVEAESVPFHEHPRFKELIKERNDLRAQMKQMEQIINQYYQSAQTPPNPQDTEIQNFLQPYLDKFTTPYKQALGQLADELDKINLINDKRFNITPEMLQEIEDLRQQYLARGIVLPRKEIAIYLAGKRTVEREEQLLKEHQKSKENLSKINQSAVTESGGTATSAPQKDFKSLSIKEMEERLKDVKF